ncbi:unnamed protein product [Heterosigma akashiwo]
MQPLGFVVFTLQYGVHRFTIVYRIFENLSHEMIIGNRTLYQRGARLCYEILTMSIKDDDQVRVRIPITVGEMDGVNLPSDLSVIITERVVIPPFSHSYLPGRVVSAGKEEIQRPSKPVAVLVEGADRLHQIGIAVARSIGALHDTGSFPVVLQNYTDMPVVLNKGKKLGTVSLLSSVSLQVGEDGWIHQSEKPLMEIPEDELREKLEATLANDLSADQKSRLLELLLKNKVLFQSLKPGKTTFITHRINSSGISYTRPYRLAESEISKVEAICEEMERDGIIAPSNSPYNSPVLLVGKKDSSAARFCLDLRNINKITKAAHYPVDSSAECFDALGNGSWYFSSCDILSAFWNVPVDPKDTEKLAFTVRSKKYEFLVTPFGLKDSPYTFMMLMNQVLGPSKWSYSLSYVDDLIIYSKNDFDLHLRHLQDVFDRLTKANLRLKVSKCTFASGSVAFLGHVVGRHGISPDPKKVEAVKNLARPNTKKQVRQFLGMVGFYRSLIKNFSITAAPLH